MRKKKKKKKMTGRLPNKMEKNERDVKEIH